MYLETEKLTSETRATHRDSTQCDGRHDRYQTTIFCAANLRKYITVSASMSNQHVSLADVTGKVKSHPFSTYAPMGQWTKCFAYANVLS